MSRKNSTSSLLRNLFDAPDIENFIECNATDMEDVPFHFHLLEICEHTGEIPEQVIRRAGIERTYGHQLFNGTRNPSRDKVIQLAIGFGLDFEATQQLLQAARKSLLYPKIKRDAAIIHCIHHKKDIYETQALLETLEITLLSGEKP